MIAHVKCLKPVHFGILVYCKDKIKRVPLHSVEGNLHYAEKKIKKNEKEKLNENCQMQ